MVKHKIFVYDNLCIGFADSMEYMKNQIHVGFATLTGDFRLWYTGRVFLTEMIGSKGCKGEVYEIDEHTLNRLDTKYLSGKDKKNTKFTRKKVKVTVSATNEVIECECYIYDLAELRKRGVKASTIYDYRLMSTSLGDGKHQPKLCC